MERKYSLVHFSDINCPPPEMIHVAAKTGYDYVSVRIIPMGLPGEVPHDIARNKVLFRETKKAIEDTGVRINDIENARIFDGVDIKSYEPSFAAAAELGVKHVLGNIWTPDKAYYTEKFCELCELAAQYDLTINAEFVTWANVPDLQTAKALLLETGYKNVGIVVDVLHFYRSKCHLEEFDTMPKEWFNFIHLCDCEAEIPTDNETLARTAREERLYPGEGVIDIASIAAKIPDVIYGLEVPNTKRRAAYGYEEHARRAIQQAKEIFK